ncbi:MAG: hypothetical protein Q7K65_05885 [Candidatus Buchananbacteria bacterium]|nr:hypothetical protein [Candidatus Buchananbacteria bacterium]
MMKFLFPLSLLFIFIFLPFSASALTIAPAIIDINLDPGQSQTYQLQLYNETGEDIFLNGSIEKFEPKGENGQTQILPFDVSDKSVNWIKLPNNSLVLRPGESISVPVVIDIPKTAGLGGYYLAVMWESSSGPQSAKSHQALVSSRVGELVLLEVKGEVNNNLEIIDFNLKTTRNFYSSLPIDFFLRLRNSGNIHERPQGSIIIKNLLGQTVEALTVNGQSGAILPGTIRVFETVWSLDENKNLFSNLAEELRHFAIGRFSAQALVTYGDGKSLDSELIYFWVIPWLPLALIVLFLLAVAALIKVFKRKNKHRNAL